LAWNQQPGGVLTPKSEKKIAAEEDLKGGLFRAKTGRKEKGGGQKKVSSSIDTGTESKEKVKGRLEKNCSDTRYAIRIDGGGVEILGTLEATKFPESPGVLRGSLPSAKETGG